MLSLKAGGTGLNLTAANHVVLYDRWWNPAVEDQARDRAWRIGQDKTVISHRLVCPGTVDERVEEVVAGKRHIAQLVLPRSSSIADLDTDQLRIALGLRPDELLSRGRRDEPAPPPLRRRRRRPAAPAPGAASTSGGPPTPLPEVEPIAVPDDVGALLRSLGEPPTIDGSVIAAGYFTAVVERAAAIAAALALSADLLRQPSDR